MKLQIPGPKPIESSRWSSLRVTCLWDYFDSRHILSEFSSIQHISVGNELLKTAYCSAHFSQYAIRKSRSPIPVRFTRFMNIYFNESYRSWHAPEIRSSSTRTENTRANHLMQCTVGFRTFAARLYLLNDFYKTSVKTSATALNRIDKNLAAKLSHMDSIHGGLNIIVKQLIGWKSLAIDHWILENAFSDP